MKWSFWAVISKKKTEKVSPADFPDDEFSILGVSNKYGVFENEVLLGEEIKQKYKKVHKGDLVYNPHRVNVGSIGLVPEECDGGYVSGIYIVFRSKNAKIPPEFILTLLKSDAYKKVIEAYDTKYGAVRANLTYEQLGRIRIPILPPSQLKKFMDHFDELAEIEKKLKDKRALTGKYLGSIIEKK